MELKKILSFLMAFVLLFTSIQLPVSAKSEPFDDAKGHWAEENINWSQEKGLVKGYPDGKFMPEGKITKAEFITIINNFMKAKKGSNFSFKDVKESDWYYEEVRKAVNYYLEDGDYFKGDEYINRDEAAKLIASAYGLKEIVLNNFKDSDEIVNKGAVGALVAEKILNGYPDGSFKPKNSITRAEASKIFNVSYDNIGEPSEDTASNPNKKQKVNVKSSTSTSSKSSKHHHHSSGSSHNNNNNSNDNSTPMYPIGPSEPVNPGEKPGEETKTLEEIKNEAKNKIDNLENLTDDEKKAVKDKIDAATTEKEINNIVEEAKDKNDKVNKGDSVKFGVISDIHLDKGNERQVNRTIKALNFFEDNKAASTFIVGDVTNSGTEAQYKEYEKVKAGRKGNKMEVHASMGNHEGGSRELFTKYYGDDPNAHYKINGYHFITVSPDGNGWSGEYTNVSRWLSKELEIAKNDTGNKPIFVFFHHPIKDTFYVSEEWNGNMSKDVFEDYPMAVTFSGHIHSPNNHPRSIWQDNFTAVNTVSLNYFEMEKGYYKDGSIPRESDKCAQGMLIEADGTKVKIRNRDFISDEWIDQTWTFDTAHPEDFPYTDARYEKAKAPKFEEGTEVTTNVEGTSVDLEFNQAKVDPESVKGDIVHSYEFEIKGNGKVVKTVKDWSGFYLIPMPEKMDMKINDLKPNKEYTVNIYPVDAFKKKGKPITTSFTTGEKPYIEPTPNILDVNISERSDGSDANNREMKVVGDPIFTKDSVKFNGTNGLRYKTDSKVYEDINKYGFTVELYYIPNNLSKNTDPMGNTQNSGFCFEETGNGETVQFWVSINGKYKKLNAKLTQGELVHLLATYDKEELKLYKNGKLVETLKAPGDVKEPPHYIFLGGDTSSNGDLEYASNAEIKMARVYTGYMNEEEVKEAYTNATSQNPVDPGEDPENPQEIVADLLDVNLDLRPDGSDANGHQKKVFGEPEFKTEDDRNTVLFDGETSALRYETDDEFYNKINDEDGFTVEFYFKPYSLSGDPLGNTESSGFGFEYEGSKLEFWGHIGGSYKIFGPEISAGEWKHIAVTYDKSEVKYYVDGELKESITTSGNIKVPPHYLFLGADTWGNGNPQFYSNAEFNIARVYSKSLTEDNIRELYKSIKPLKDGLPEEEPTEIIEEGTDTGSVKFGVISDIHLDKDNKRQVNRTTKALNFFEDNEAASTFIVGDVTNSGKEAQYKEYDKVKAGRTGNEMTVHASMGNHEGGSRKLFTKYYGDEPNAHYKINGYHFITVSPDGDGWKGDYTNVSSWLSKELEIAKNDTGDKPIFVFFHHPIKDTFYVSNEWHGNMSKDVFEDYPMAVTFSGHIHSPNNHPRSIWQDKFTAVNTVSLYYFEMESGYNNGDTHPKKSDKCAQGMLIEADGTKVKIRNRDFISDKWIDQEWTFDTAHPEKFPYTNARYENAKAPKFEEGTEVTTKVEATSVDLEFNQAKVDSESVEGDIVHSYEFEIKENGEVLKTVKDWSGFYLIPMPEKMNMKINDLKPNTEYTVDIYPVDAFKKKGKPITVKFKTNTESNKLESNLLDENLELRENKLDDKKNLDKILKEPSFKDENDEPRDNTSDENYIENNDNIIDDEISNEENIKPSSLLKDTLSNI